MLNHVAIPLALYPGFLVKTSLNIDSPGPGPPGPLYNTHTVPSLNFAWLSHGVPLLGAPGTGLLCPSTVWGSINEFSPNTEQRRAKGQQYPQLALGTYLNFDFGVGYPGVRTTFMI